MSHHTQTTVRHWLELTEAERFEYADWNGKPTTVIRLEATVVDGSLSSVVGTGRAHLKSGALGNVDKTIRFFGSHREVTHKILRAHGIPTPTPVVPS
jgi:hypothetical protein